MGMSGGSSDLLAAAEAQRRGKQEHQRKGLIVEPRPIGLPDNLTSVSYEKDQMESDRIRKWMKEQWGTRQKIISPTF